MNGNSIFRQGARLLDGKPWVPSDVTNVRVTLKAHGHIPPEQRAQEAEQEARHEGALRAMKRIQAEESKVTRLDEWRHRK